MRHLVHYPQYIRLLGPLKSFWCMRFETKHSYFKSLQRRIRNCINSPKTLSMRHQQWQCNQFRSAGKKILKFQVTKSPITLQLLENHRCAGQIASLLNLETVLDVSVQSLKWIEIGSNTFKKNESLILCPLNGSTKGAFGFISSIVAYEEKLVFVVKIYRTVNFDNHLQAFHIAKREDRFQLAVSPYELCDMSVYHSPGCCRSNNLYVPTQSEIKSFVL